MYLYHNDALPISFTQLLQTGNQIHQYSTRYSDFYRPHTRRTNTKKNSILFQCPRIWNSLPNNIVNVPTLNIFRRVIKPFLRVRQDAALHIYFFSLNTLTYSNARLFSQFLNAVQYLNCRWGEICIPHISVGFSEISLPQLLLPGCMLILNLMLNYLLFIQLYL